MSATLHTIAPWDANEDGTSIVARLTRVVVAAVSPSPDDPGGLRRKANARLLAAAPDLLAATRHLQGCFSPPGSAEHAAFWGEQGWAHTLHAQRGTTSDEIRELVLERASEARARAEGRA